VIKKTPSVAAKTTKKKVTQQKVVAKKKVVQKKVVAKKAAAPKPPVSKQAAVSKAPMRKKTAAKPAVAPKKKAVSKPVSKPVISPRERYEMVAKMAYYRAEKRDFAPGHEKQDWLECEQIIDQMIKNNDLG